MRGKGLQLTSCRAPRAANACEQHVPHSAKLPVYCVSTTVCRPGHDPCSSHHPCQATARLLASLSSRTADGGREAYGAETLSHLCASWQYIYL